MNKQNFSSIVILTGAGISAESGIKTFRDQDGLWENHRIEEVATPEAFIANPDLVHLFYNARREQLFSEEVEHNKGHEAIATLIKEFKGDVTLVTQNVDDLHERAGRALNLPDGHVIHMHGELSKMRCKETQNVFTSEHSLDKNLRCPCCKRPGNLRPHIVWFGEMPFYLDKIYEALSKCELFISIGTSGNVYPASQFVSFTQEDCYRLEVNLAETTVSPLFHNRRIGKAGDTLPELIEDILKGHLFNLSRD